MVPTAPTTQIRDLRAAAGALEGEARELVEAAHHLARAVEHLERARSAEPEETLSPLERMMRAEEHAVRAVLERGGHDGGGPRP